MTAPLTVPALTGPRTFDLPPSWPLLLGCLVWLAMGMAAMTAVGLQTEGTDAQGAAATLTDASQMPERDEKLEPIVIAAQQAEMKGQFEEASRQWMLAADYLTNKYGEGSWQATNAQLEAKTSAQQAAFTAQQKQVAGQIQALEETAAAASAQGDWTSVVGHLQEAIQLTSQLFGADSHVVARIRIQAGQILHSINEPQRAWEMYHDALPALRAAMGVDHPEVEALNYSMGNLLQINQQPALAIPWLKQAAESSERIFGAESTLYSDRLAALGVALYETGEVDEAAIRLAEAAEIQSVVLPGEHPKRAQTLMDLGVCCLALKQNDQAVIHLTEASTIFAKTLGDSDPFTVGARTHLATGLVLVGQGEQAESVLRQVLAVHASPETPNELAAARIRFKLAILTGRTGRYEEAETLLRESIAGQQKLLGASHAETVRGLEALAALLDKASRPHDAEQIREYMEKLAAQPTGDGNIIR